MTPQKRRTISTINPSYVVRAKSGCQSTEKFYMDFSGQIATTAATYLNRIQNNFELQVF